jgi:hypothetical protein
VLPGSFLKPSLPFLALGAGAELETGRDFFPLSSLASVGNSIFFTRKYALFNYLIVKFGTVAGVFWCEGPKSRTVTGWI